MTCPQSLITAAEIGKYVDHKEVARLERYVTIR
jgi:hypothetical protein